MEHHDFPLKNEYIELYKLLKLLGICESGATAKMDIEGGFVTVDGKIETRKRCKIRKGQSVQIDETTITVQ